MTTLQQTFTPHGKIAPIESERVLVSAQFGMVTLTTHRVRLLSDSFGAGRVGSMLLSEVASCNVFRRSKPIFLWIAGFFFASSSLAATLSMLQQNTEMLAGSGVSLFLAFLFLGAYFLFRSSVLEIASTGSAVLRVGVGGSWEQAIAFINELETAKHFYQPNR